MAETLKAEAVERMARAIHNDDPPWSNELQRTYVWTESVAGWGWHEIYKRKASLALAALLALLRERGHEDVVRMLEGE